MEEVKKEWYDKLFGGRKSMHGFWVSALGFLAYLGLPASAKAQNIYYLFGFLLMSFGILGWFNYSVHKLNGGNGNG